MVCPECNGIAWQVNKKPSGYERHACRSCGHKWSINAKARGRPRLNYPPPKPVNPHEIRAKATAWAYAGLHD